MPRLRLRAALPAAALLTCACERPPATAIDDCPSGRRCAWDGYCAVPAQPPGVRFMNEEESLAAAVRDVKRRYRSTASASSIGR